LSEVFIRLYETYKEMIYNYLYHLSLDPHLAEELTQETFIKAFRFEGQFRGEASAKTWLVRIAINTYHSHRRRIPTPAWELHEQTPDPLDYSQKSETKLIIEAVFRKLSERDRELLTLREISDLTYAEIARVTGMSDTQVKVGLHRARSRFKELYTELSKEGNL